MTRPLVASVALVASLFAPSADHQGRDVVFEVVVERANGSFVEGLKAEDFVVSSGGTERPVGECVVDEGPVSAVLMIDVSSSSRWPGLDDGPQRERWIDDNLLVQFRGHDRVRLAAFGRRVAMSAGFTTGRSAARRSLAEVMALGEEARSGPSPIWDALDEAISALEPEPGRRAAILITDGKATANQKDLADVASRAVLLGIPVSTVAVGQGTFLIDQGSNQTAVVSPGLALQRLSRATGGLAVVMPHGNILPSPLTAVSLALRRAYRISVPMNPGWSRSSGVTVRPRDDRFIYRSSSRSS